MGTRHDLKTASYQGQRDGVMMGRDPSRFVMYTNRQAILHYREERDAECCWYAGRVRRGTDGNILVLEASPNAETNLWFRGDARSNSNTRARWTPNGDSGRN